MPQALPTNALLGPQLIHRVAQTTTKTFMLHSEAGAERSIVEQYIAAKFKQSHGASIEKFLPFILEMRSDDSIDAAIGLRPGHFKPMFLEQYLDGPVEQQIAQFSNRPIDRSSLIEVGNLVVTKRAAGLILFLVVAAALAKANYEWMVFTVTPEVERLMQRLGFTPSYLVMADQSKLERNTTDWGCYYENAPKVMVGSLTEAQNIIDDNEILSTLVEKYASAVEQLAQPLVKHRVLMSVSSMLENSTAVTQRLLPRLTSLSDKNQQ